MTKEPRKIKVVDGKENLRLQAVYFCQKNSDYVSFVIHVNPKDNALQFIMYDTPKQNLSDIENYKVNVNSCNLDTVVYYDCLTLQKEYIHFKEFKKFDEVSLSSIKSIIISDNENTELLCNIFIDEETMEIKCIKHIDFEYDIYSTYGKLN